MQCAAPSARSPGVQQMDAHVGDDHIVLLMRAGMHRWALADEAEEDEDETDENEAEAEEAEDEAEDEAEAEAAAEADDAVRAGPSTSLMLEL